MNFNVLGYYLKEGYENLFKNKRATFASILIMSFTLLLFGIFMLISMNVKQLVKNLVDNQAIQVFIDIDAKDNDIEIIKSKILGIKINDKNAVVSLKFKSKQEAYEDVKNMFKNNKGFENNFENTGFLPASFLLKIENLDNAQKVKEEIETFENVKEVRDQQKLIKKVLQISKIVNIVIISIISILLISSIFIISNTIKLSVFSRKKEINIMKYVGASDDFVKGPFIVESIFMGMISVIMPIIILAILYNLFTDYLININHNIQASSQALNIINFTTVLPNILLIFIVLSIGLGIFASTMSMRKYLSV